jgi:hemoglobin-like flavoprotein
MTLKDRELVQDSWAKVIPNPDTVAELFYNRLFELNPSLRLLFRSDMTEQGRKLTAMITVAVNGLDNLDNIVPSVRALGKRHAAYGVKDEHYDAVASALLWTLERALGDAFNEDTRHAWISIYAILSDTMKTAAAAESGQLAGAVSLS